MPSMQPSKSPTDKPSDYPSNTPTDKPSPSPSDRPTGSPVNIIITTTGDSDSEYSDPPSSSPTEQVSSTTAIYVATIATSTSSDTDSNSVTSNRIVSTDTNALGGTSNSDSNSGNLFKLIEDNLIIVIVVGAILILLIFIICWCSFCICISRMLERKHNNRDNYKSGSLNKEFEPQTNVQVNPSDTWNGNTVIRLGSVSPCPSPQPSNDINIDRFDKNGAGFNNLGIASLSQSGSPSLSVDVIELEPQAASRDGRSVISDDSYRVTIGGPVSISNGSVGAANAIATPGGGGGGDNVHITMAENMAKAKSLQEKNYNYNSNHNYNVNNNNNNNMNINLMISGKGFPPAINETSDYNYNGGGMGEDDVEAEHEQESDVEGKDNIDNNVHVNGTKKQATRGDSKNIQEKKGGTLWARNKRARERYRKRAEEKRNKTKKPDDSVTNSELLYAPKGNPNAFDTRGGKKDGETHF